MKQLRIVNGLILSCVLVGCSTASVSVMPGESINRVIARDTERDGAEQAAISGANKYCVNKGKEAVFVSDHTDYTGRLDESTRDLIRNGSQAAFLLGGFGRAPRDDAVTGNILSTAGSVGYVMTSGRDYEAVTEFRCR